MLQVSVATKRTMQVLHAKWEGGGQGVDCPRGDISGDGGGG